MVVDGTPYAMPTGLVWNSLFLAFFIIGGAASTLIPLSFGSQHNWIGQYLSSPIGGKTREELAATSPEDLGLGDLPPAVIFIGAALVAMSLLSCVIQKLEFPETKTMLGDTIMGLLAFLGGGGALGLCVHTLATGAGAEQAKTLGLICAAALPWSYWKFVGF